MRLSTWALLWMFGWVLLLYGYIGVFFYRNFRQRHHPLSFHISITIASGWVVAVALVLHPALDAYRAPVMATALSLGLVFAFTIRRIRKAQQRVADVREEIRRRKEDLL